MTVGELRERIKDIPYQIPVVLSRDAEGNGFSEVWEVETTDWDSDWMEPIEESDPDNKFHTKVVLIWPDR